MRNGLIFATVTFTSLGIAMANAAAQRAMTVWKTPGCGCCAEWSDEMRKAGYDVTLKDMQDPAGFKAVVGVPADMESCHTATLEGYFLEGHVPLEAIDKLLDERPAIAGLAVPGMPQGSLGMGNDPQARYDVYAVGSAGGAKPAIYYSVGTN